MIFNIKIIVLFISFFLFQKCYIESSECVSNGCLTDVCGIIVESFEKLTTQEKTKKEKENLYRIINR